MTRLNFDEYRKKYPRLAKETEEILNSNKALLKYLRQGNKKSGSSLTKTILKRKSLPKRIKEAVKPRIIRERGCIRVLNGKPLSEVSSQQKKAYRLQEEIVERQIWYPQEFKREGKRKGEERD